MRIGFIGAGQMARAFASGMVNQGLVAASDLAAADCSQAARDLFEKEVPGATTQDDNQAVVANADLVLLAVKPHHVPLVATALGKLSDEKLLISIAAGVTLEQLSGWFSTDRVVRVMPNTPCLVGVGASGYCCGPSVTDKDRDEVRRLLESVGICFELAEPLLDAVTGLSGSGPAFVYKFIESLSDGGVRMGLPRDIALQLAAQTVSGAAEMVKASGDHPAVLKDRVTSPGGTTIAGIDALEQGAFRGTVIQAVKAAAERSRELGQSED